MSTPLSGIRNHVSNLNVGGHLSLNGKPRATVEWAGANGFQSMQIFASSPGAWKRPVLSDDDFRDFVLARQEQGVDPLFIHAIYLINLASPNPELVRRSRVSLAAALQAGALMKAAGVVTHIGSHGGRGFGEVAAQVAENLQEILAQAPNSIDLVLENSAGAGGIIGADLSELAQLIELAGRHRGLKVGLDTAHLFGAGWDLRRPEVVERLVEDVEWQIGLDRLVLIHANDSKVDCGARRDRHANIGEGFIGLEGFRNLLSRPALRRLPWILETPELERRVDDRATLEALAIEMVPVGEAHGS